MIYHRANVFILLPLALLTSASLLLGFALECRADDGVQLDEQVKQAKSDWLGEFRRLLGERVAEKTKAPEEIVELLKQLQATMPQDYDDDEWQMKRTELGHLIDMAKVDERCPGRDAFKQYKVGVPKYSLFQYTLPGVHLLRAYVKHFETKQVRICVNKITGQLVSDVGSLSEKDKHDMEALMSYLPLMQASDDWEWNKWVAYAIVGEDDEQLYEAILRFLDAKAGPLSRKLVRPGRKAKFDALFHDRMGFCNRIEAATNGAMDEYLGINHDALVDKFVTLFAPETLKWIKAAKLCRQIVNDEFLRPIIYENFKAANPSMAVRLISSCLKPKQ